MKKIILTIAGSALVALSTVQFAAAEQQQHRAKTHHRAEFRDSNAYAAPAYEAPQVYNYSGGISAPAGR